MVAKKKLSAMGIEITKTTGNTKTQIAEKISALECDVMKKWIKTPPAIGPVLGFGNKNV
jgi:hypothetical protein